MKNFRTLISKCSSCIVEFRGFFKSAGFWADWSWKEKGRWLRNRWPTVLRRAWKRKILSFGSRLNVSGLIFREKPDDFGNFVEKNLFLRVF
jgi:hypothetical protein